MSKIDDLRWVRVFTPIHIPKYLVDQIKKKDYTTEDFYKYQELVCLRNSPEGPTLNPFSHLYVLVNSENITKGFLWFTVEPLTRDLVIQTYTVDKEYWGGGGAIRKLSDHVKEVRSKADLNKIYWVTDYPRHSQRHGFRASKSVLMEYSEEEDGKTHMVGRSEPRGEYRPKDTCTEIHDESHPEESSSPGLCEAVVQGLPASV